MLKSEGGNWAVPERFILHFGGQLERKKRPRKRVNFGQYPLNTSGGGKSEKGLGAPGCSGLPQFRKFLTVVTEKKIQGRRFGSQSFVAIGQQKAPPPAPELKGRGIRLAAKGTLLLGIFLLLAIRL